MPAETAQSGHDILQQVNAFYEEHPFPGFDLRKYSYSEDLRQRASWVGKLFDAQIPYRARVLEAGCGTGQLTSFLSLKQRAVLGIDYSQKSLQKAEALKQRLQLRTAEFRRANVLELDLPDESFDYVLCLGVLHHTSDPYRGFQNLVRVTRPQGFIILGLYNRFGRMPVALRRKFKRIFGSSRIEDEAIRRQLCGQDGDIEKNESWLADQYHHPYESTHTIGEVLHWLESNRVSYVSSIPPIELFRSMKKNARIFKRYNLAPWRRSLPARFLVQAKWIASLRDNGGYFIIIGQKRCTS